MSDIKVELRDYPLGKKRSELIFTPGGMNIQDITFENIERGIIKPDDCRTSRESLVYQAQLAEQQGNKSIADNFYRASEMVDIESSKIINIYNSIRPYRSTEAELKDIISDLRNTYNADRTAEFIEEALAVLKLRGKLRGDR